MTIPNPTFMAPFVGVVEILCGLLLLIGLTTRFAAVPLIINMLVAITTAKIPAATIEQTLALDGRKWRARIMGHWAQTMRPVLKVGYAGLFRTSSDDQWAGESTPPPEPFRR